MSKSKLWGTDNPYYGTKWYEERLKKAAEVLGKRNAGSYILDVGCGPCALQGYGLIDTDKVEYIGLDINVEYLRKATKN